MNSALQAAIYSALTGNAPLMSAVTGVYDKAPQATDSGSSTAFPYVTIGDDIISAWATDDWSGGDAVFRIHVWSRYGGNKEANQIIGLVRDALDRVPLSVTGYTALSVDFEQAFVEPDPDGETRHGVMEFRVLICP